MKTTRIRFAIEVPLVPPDVIDMEAVVFDLRALVQADAMHAGMLARGFGEADAGVASELVLDGYYLDLEHRGHA